MAEINPNTAESLIATMADIANKGVLRVTLLLSTPGGAVPKGIAVYNSLRAMPFELITHNVGNVDSVGNVVFLAGNQRFACPHSTFMFHGVAWHATDGEQLTRGVLKERTEGLLADEKRIGAIIRERTKMRATDVDALFNEAKTKDATDAVSGGIVHEIKDVEITPGAPILSLVFQR
ncbi:MAG TPA: ATP-dependent Clp protease proteolytic subunit [Solirubrobacteraceae bacterium]|nr:ATP-dependent Clp protease proteolytic subunit [Solirubrobacteraceae bacterium]